MPEALPVDAFVAEMEAIREKHHVRDSRFIRSFVERGLGVPELKIFLKEYYWGMAFDGFFSFAAIAANASPMHHRELYFEIMHNLSSEAGHDEEQGRDHDQLHLLLSNHLGISDGEMYDHVPSAATQGYRHTMVACCRRTVESGVACIPFSIEGQGGEMHELMWEGFQRHFDFPDEVMAYWKVHDELEGEHGDVAEDMIRLVSKTAEQQWRVRDAVQATCATYRAFWDQFDTLVER